MNHRVNFGQFKLCTDIEKNPGPSVYVDSTKTINAPYCQGNVTGFGENGGQRRVAMSLCALIYSKITKMTSVDDMTQIMIVCIQLYSCLSTACKTIYVNVNRIVRNGYSVSAIFSTLNTVTVILVTSITTVYDTHRLQHFKHSWH